MKKLWLIIALTSSLLFGWFKYDVGMMTGSIKGTYIKFGEDTMDLMKRHDILVRPMVSYGSQINLISLKKSRGVDLAIVQADVLNIFKLQAEYNRDIRNIIKNVRYITKLYDEEIHIVTYEGSGINNLKDLNRKVINIGSAGSGTELTSQIIINALGIRASRLEHLAPTKALEALKNKKIDVAIFVGGKPLGYLKDNMDGLKFVNVSNESINILSQIYNPTNLTHQDYQNIPEDIKIQTIAVPSILACYNWPKSSGRRYQSIIAFMKTLYEYKEVLEVIGEKKGHYKWKDINFYDIVPGWKRHPYMERLLRRPIQIYR